MKTCTCGIGINEHPASECLDRLVSLKIMSKKLPATSWRNGRTVFMEEINDELRDIPSYSSDISAAWEVVEKILELPCSVNIQRDFHSDGNHTACYIHEYPRDDTPLIMAHAEETPLAICKAALFTVEE